MVIGDKILNLRKKAGLSQEQLANELNISRQSISKWESGASMPDNDKLISLSKYFGVSLDYLMKDEIESVEELIENKSVSAIVETPTKNSESSGNKNVLVGLVVCIVGVICFILWMVIQIAMPKTSEQIQASSVVTIDGNGILLCLFVIAIVVGVVILVKGLINKK